MAKVILLPRILGIEGLGTLQAFKVIRGSVTISKTDLKTGAVRNVAIDMVTWDKFIAREYDFDIIGSVTNLLLDAYSIDFSVVTDVTG